MQRCLYDESASGWRDIVNDAERRGDLDGCERAALMARIACTREEGRKVLCVCIFLHRVDGFFEWSSFEKGKPIS